METEDKRAFVAALVREHGHGLRRFLAARLREAVTDVPDLVQEVYLRLLRIPKHESIRSPQAYLFTVAHHVLHQHKMSLAAVPESVEITETLAEIESLAVQDPAQQLDTHQRIERLNRVLEEVSPRCRAVFLLHRRFGFSLDEIAVKIGVSRPMAKKYLFKAVSHCKRRFEGME